MTDYTPTTEQVRNAYVRGMRDTFIASAGEHREEFDRWVAAHDAEARNSVQPPSREQIAEAIWDDSLLLELPENLDRVDRVLALFRQPTPSAEQ